MVNAPFTVFRRGRARAVRRRRSALLEQFFGCGAVRLRLSDVRFDARNLRLQRLDSRVQLVDRHRIEVLSCELDQRVARLAREQVVEVHEGIVDP